jgi:hypothetical protein
LEGESDGPSIAPIRVIQARPVVHWWFHTLTGANQNAARPKNRILLKVRLENSCTPRRQVQKWVVP